jgi:ribosome-associated protein
LEDDLAAPAPDSVCFAKRCARLLDEKKIEDLKIFDVSGSLQITDFFVIGTGMNSRHLRSACDYLIELCRAEGLSRSRLEGYRNGSWVLVDFGDVVIHLFLPDRRKHYDLELLWGDCPRVEWADGNASAAARC